MRVTPTVCPFPLKYVPIGPFSVLFGRMCWEDRLDWPSVFDALEFCKCYLRAAAELSRQYIQDYESSSPFKQLQPLSIIARLVWNQDWTLANAIISRDRFVAEHVTVVGTCVSLSQPAAFAIPADELRLQDLSD